jgi:hypothetical protein
VRLRVVALRDACPPFLSSEIIRSCVRKDGIRGSGQLGTFIPSLVNMAVQQGACGEQHIYGRGLEKHLLFLASKDLTIEEATRVEIAAYVRDLLLPRFGVSNSRCTDASRKQSLVQIEEPVDAVRLGYAAEPQFPDLPVIRRKTLAQNSSADSRTQRSSPLNKTNAFAQARFPIFLPTALPTRSSDRK